MQPASPSGAQRERRDAEGSCEARDPLVAVMGATGLLQEVGGCVSRLHNTTGSCWADAGYTYFVGAGAPVPCALTENEILIVSRRSQLLFALFLCSAALFFFFSPALLFLQQCSLI
jgi:hypothetical protein